MTPPLVVEDAGNDAGTDDGGLDAGAGDAGAGDAGLPRDAGVPVVSLTLRLDFAGGGTGALETRQRTCTQGCDDVYSQTTTVSVRARTPSGRSTFSGFDVCPGRFLIPDVCEVSLVGNSRVVARFDAVASPASAVSPVHLWSSASEFDAVVVAAHPTAGVLTAVSSRGTVSFGSATFVDSVLTRFTSAGAVVRSFSFAGVSVSGAALAADGSAWLGAQLDSSNVAGGPAGGAVLHLTATDTIDLVVPLAAGRPTSLALSSVGAVAVGGLVTGALPAALSPVLLGTAQAGADAFALELSATGQVVHAWRLGGAFDELSATVLFDASDRLTWVSTLQATVSIAGVTVPGVRYRPAVAVVRFDAAGSAERAFALTAPGTYGQTRAFSATAFGTGVAIVGTSVGTPALGRASEGQAGYVAVLDANLNLAWVKGSVGVPESGALASVGNTLVVTTDYGLVGSWTTTNHLGGTAFESNSLLARFSGSGAVLTNQHLVGSVGAPRLASLGAQVVAAGWFTSGLEFAPSARAVSPYLDVWMMVLSF